MEFALHQSAVAAQLLVLPMASSAMGNGQTAALVIVQQIEDAPDQAQRLLQLAYRLTPAEARMAQLILDGHSPGQIAAILKLSIATVRTQLSSALKKTGAQRQADLVRRLSPLLFLKSPASIH
jgi:DNA-binding CsgD family transcriptional regulator